MARRNKRPEAVTDTRGVHLREAGPSSVRVGIDPGLAGAIGVIWPDGKAYSWYTPVVTTRHKWARKKDSKGKAKVSTTTQYNAKRMLALMSVIRKRAVAAGFDLHVNLEHQHPRPNDGKPQVMRLGEGFGRWKQTLEILGIPYVLVSPASWRAKLLWKGASKADALKHARKTFNLELPLVRDESRAEALLIASFDK